MPHRYVTRLPVQPDSSRNPFLPADYTPPPPVLAPAQPRRLKPAPAGRRSPRPYRTFYYAAARDASAAFSLQSHSTTLAGALSAATMRILSRLYARCAVYDDQDDLVATIARQGHSLELWTKG